MIEDQKCRFAHLADCHIGGWREEKLKVLSIKAFEETAKKIIAEKVDFVIIAGDLFNTSIPSVDALKQVTTSLREIKEANIPVYIVPGSHDFSPSGKTMLDVLENAGLCKNVHKFDEEKKELHITYHTLPNGERIALTGMCGLAGGLEKIQYETITNRREIEAITDFKIFVFHTLLTELKPSKDWEHVPSESMMLLPVGFNYYPGGHPHFVSQKTTVNHPLVAYPGPLFPNNFKELEELRQGGFYIATVKKDNQITLDHIPVQLKEILPLTIDANDKTAGTVEEEVRELLTRVDITDKIVTLRIAGTLSSGKPAEIGLKALLEEHTEAYHILKNTAKLKAKEFSEINKASGSIDEVEETIIKEHVGQLEIPDLQLNENQELLTNQLMTTLNKEKIEGEKNIDFETRIIQDMIKLFNVQEVYNAY